jgi:hypothetical protein
MELLISVLKECQEAQAKKSKYTWTCTCTLKNRNAVTCVTACRLVDFLVARCQLPIDDRQNMINLKRHHSKKRFVISDSGPSIHSSRPGCPSAMTDQKGRAHGRRCSPRIREG